MLFKKVAGLTLFIFLCMGLLCIQARAEGEKMPQFYIDPGQEITVTGQIERGKMTNLSDSTWQETMLTTEDKTLFILHGSKVPEVNKFLNEKKLITITGTLKPAIRFKGEMVKVIQIKSIDKTEDIKETENKPAGVKTAAPRIPVSVEGRIALKNSENTEELILHGMNAQTYIIKGAFSEKLKNILKEQGDKNFVTVKGDVVEHAVTECSQANSYKTTETGESILNTDSKCIDYAFLEVLEIVSSGKSEKAMPPPKHDEQGEQVLRSDKNAPLQPILGQIRGKITALNITVNSAIKNVEITNLNSDEPLKKIVLFLTVQTKIGREIDRDNQLILSVHTLKIGQEVMAIYFRDQFKCEAATITILKEN